MDVFDVLALWGRKYDQLTVPGSRSKSFSLSALLEMFSRNAIMELTPYVGNSPRDTVRFDKARKVKVSLLDNGISVIHSGSEDTYEVYRTPPSGELSKVKIIAYSPDGVKTGELRMVVGQRSYEHYFEEDPILEALGRQK